MRKKILPSVYSQKQVNNVQKKEVKGCKKKQKNKPPQKNHGKHYTKTTKPKKTKDNTTYSDYTKTWEYYEA